MKLLIVRLSSFGDVIHALPIAANAKRAGAEVGWLVEPAYRAVLEADPDVDRVFVADTKLWRRNLLSPATASDVARLRRALREFAPDRTLEAQGLWKSSLLARSAGAPVIGFAAGERKESTSALLCDEPVRPRPGGHVVDRNLALAEAAGIPIHHRSPDASFLLRRPCPEADSFLADQPTPFAVYHPGAGRPEKTWGEARFAALAKLLSAEVGLAPVVSWGPGDEKRALVMAELLPGARRMPLLPPEGLARVAARASLFVAGDTGPLHLADALGVSTLALYGPTDPARNGPYRRPHSAVRYDGATDAATVARRAFELLAA
ncbi:MAG TPA: glycosyltransferase family 9 protein [Thermoanaerobaculia bacterium]|nr:glycosyltransferase family 9 protein [Thermoanaerobaculia bacterium]